MEPLLRQVRELPGRLGTLPTSAKALLGLVLAGAVAAAAALSLSPGGEWQYAFTNLASEDAAEAASTLKAAGVPFRVEAGGSALAVPARKVYDARLLLAAAGLPRGAGVGFELFDRGDLGVSEFTQKVNLRRAIEGELARTISRLAPVRSARVHLSLAERGLYRDEDRKASAAVVLNLQPGRSLDERELAGIRHLVASAVTGLSASNVTLVDGRGNVLATESAWGEATAQQRKIEHDLERRVVELLEQAVGPGAVVARVTAQLDSAEVSTSAETVDPDATALRSERHVTQSQSQDASAVGGVAGAAANQPLQPVQPGAGVNRGSSSVQDDVRNYDVSRTTTTTVYRIPRLKRLSVAVLLDGVGGRPRPDAEVARLGDLARRAVGFDAARGDELDISSAPFVRAEESAPAAAAAPAPAVRLPPRGWLAAGAAALLALAVVAALVARRRSGRRAAEEAAALVPGARVSELEARARATLPSPAPSAAAHALPERAGPAEQLRARAQALAAQDPARAAHVLKSWMAEGSDA